MNESVIQLFVHALGLSFSHSRDFYVAIQEDIAEGWTLSNTLAYIGLGVLAPTKPVKQVLDINSNRARKDFGDLCVDILYT